MKIIIGVHPMSLGGSLDFKRTNLKQKAFVSVRKTLAGHYYMQFHASCGYLTSYIHQTTTGFSNVDGLSMPKYVLPLISYASKYIDNLVEG